jgi:hypothetical protein
MYHYLDCVLHWTDPACPVRFASSASGDGWSSCPYCGRNWNELATKNQHTVLPDEAREYGIQLRDDLPEGVSFRAETLLDMWGFDTPCGHDTGQDPGAGETFRGGESTMVGQSYTQKAATRGDVLDTDGGTKPPVVGRPVRPTQARLTTSWSTRRKHKRCSIQ